MEKSQGMGTYHASAVSSCSEGCKGLASRNLLPDWKTSTSIYFKPLENRQGGSNNDDDYIRELTLSLALG